MDQGSYSRAQLGGSLPSATSLPVGAVPGPRAPPSCGCCPWAQGPGRQMGEGEMVRGMARQDGDVS